MLWGGGALGAVGSVAGLVLSYRIGNLPSGAAIVLVLGVIFVVAWVFSPRYGLIRRVSHRRHFHEESLARWPGEGSKGDRAAQSVDAKET
jgi:hypothetical protein